MKSLIIADLHYDRWQRKVRNPLEGPNLADLDLVVLAGDLTNNGKKRWPDIIGAVCDAAPRAAIFCVPGNHDFYKAELDAPEKLKAATEAVDAHYVQKSEVVVEDVRFLFCTLWTDFEIGPGRVTNEQLIPPRMNDFKAIRIAKEGYRKARVTDFVTRHLDHVNWLQERLSQPSAAERTVVITHHAPVVEALLKGVDDPVAAAYASDLTWLIEKYQIDDWFFGHTHHPLTLEVAGTRLTNVSLGYPHDVPDPRRRVQELIFDW